MKILILGHKGMLGSMVCAYFKYMGTDYTTTDLKWPTLDFEKYLEDFKILIKHLGTYNFKTTH